MSLAEEMLDHDWTGVFASQSGDTRHIVLTACHHDDNQFYQLGVVEHEVSWETLLRNLPTEKPHDCASASICWILDFHDGEAGVVDDREITAEAAAAFLGRDLDEALAVGQANLNAWIETH